MVTRIGGNRRKTRHMLSKPRKTRGKLSLTNFFQKFDIGSRVILKAEPAYQKGMYFRRFHGKVGKVLSMTGRCYNIKIKDGKSSKTVVVHPIHLKKE